MPKKGLKPEILKAVVCEDEIVDNRIFGSYCLYFDKVFVPVIADLTFPRYDHAMPNDRNFEQFMWYSAFMQHHFMKDATLSDVLVFPTSKTWCTRMKILDGLKRGDLVQQVGKQRVGLQIGQMIIDNNDEPTEEHGEAGVGFFPFSESDKDVSPDYIFCPRDLWSYVLCINHRAADDELSTEPVFVSQFDCHRNKYFENTYNPKNLKSNANWLASFIALKAIQMVLPSEKGVDATHIRELREKLKDVLEPFRMSMLVLTRDLRGYISDPEINLREVIKEAEFIVQSTITPQLYEIRKKIEKHNDSLIRKIFGTVLKVLCLGGKFALMPSMPSPGNTIEAVQSLGQETMAIGEQFYSRISTTSSGLMLLSRIQDHFAS